MIIVAVNPIELMNIKSLNERLTLKIPENQPGNPVKYSSAR